MLPCEQRPGRRLRGKCSSLNLYAKATRDLLYRGEVLVMNTVDVVIPCYNYGRYLRGCVRSVLSQSDVHVRVLVIDDASSDDTPVIGRELENCNRTVKFERHEVNKGHIATYNEGLLGWSTADYTVLLSADDLLTPGSLGRAVRVMEADKSIGMVYGRTIHFER